MLEPELKVKLLHNSPISLLGYAARTCTATLDKMDSILGEDVLAENDLRILQERILAESKMNPAHESIIEHATYCFEIINVSRLLLQELMRHRMASPSVQSTRYALKKLLERLIGKNNPVTEVILNNMLILTGDEDVDDLSRAALNGMIELWKKRGKIPNDRLKFALPESFRVRLLLTINARSLRNLFVLRTSKKALWEIRRLAFGMVDVLPDSHQFLYEDRIHDRPERFRHWLKES